MSAKETVIRHGMFIFAKRSTKTSMEIDEIRKIGETQTTEFKSSFNIGVIESLAAFANTKGGHVYVGISDNGKVVGCDLSQESLPKWLNEIKSKTEPQLIPDVEILAFDTNNVVVFRISEYPVKPVAVQGRYFQRKTNSNHLMTASEISNMALQTRQLSWDSYPAIGKSLSDIDRKKVTEFVRKVNEAGRFQLNGRTWIENLQKLKLLDGENPTNAAYLLFGKGNVGYGVHIGRFKTPSLIIADKMLNGSLFEVVEEAMQTIVGHLKFAFDINIVDANTQRKEIPEYPLNALREMLLNAIIHRDYTSSTDIQIKIFDQKLQIFNPSGLYGDITIEQLKTDSYSASTRNRLIAEAFYLTKDIEKYGSGFIRIRQAIADYPTMKYEFRNEGNGFYASLMYEKQKMSDGGRVGNDTLNLENDTLNLENDTLNHGNDTLNIEDKILLMLKDNPHTTLSQMAEHMGVSRITVQRLLSLLQQQGRVLRIGARKNGYWQISEKKLDE